MATRELLVLSSSPLRIPDSDVIVTPECLRHVHTETDVPLSPSSPDLPSPSSLFRRRPPGLKSGLHAAEIPKGATLGFASAAALINDRRLSLGEGSEDHSAGTTRKKSAGDASKTAEGGKTKQPAKRASKKQNPEEGDGSAPKKPRKRPKTGESDNVGTMQEDTEFSRKVTPAAKARKRKPKADVGFTAALKDQADRDSTADAERSETTREKQAQKPRQRKSKAPLDNSELIKDAIGQPDVDRQTNAPEVSVNAQGTAEVPGINRLKSRKAKSKNTDVLERTHVGEERLSKQGARAQNTRKASENVSKHFLNANPEDQAVTEQQSLPSRSQTKQPLDLEPAVSRRLDWTPTKDTTSPRGLDPSQPINLCESPLTNRITVPAQKTPFASLVNSFGYAGQTAEPQAEPRTASGEAFTKRRKLEPINKPVTPNIPKPDIVPASVEKPAKAAKKKPRTITELATAAYRPVPVLPSPQDSTVSTFSAPGDGNTALADPADPAKSEKPKRAPRQKSPEKKDDDEKLKKSNRKTKKAVKLAAEKLLSPDAARLKMNQQDILFGTSSQLAREDSPTFVRDLQQAIRDSEPLGSQRDSTETLHLRPSITGAGLSLIGKRKGLWAAATRDLDEGMLYEETTDVRKEDILILGNNSGVHLSETDRELPSPTQDPTTVTFVDIAGSSDEARITSTARSLSPNRLNAFSRFHEDKQLQCVEDSFSGLPKSRPIGVSSDYVDIDELEEEIRLSQQHQSQTGRAESITASRRSPFRPVTSPYRPALQSLQEKLNIPPFQKSTSDVSGAYAKSTLAGRSRTVAGSAVPDSEPVQAKRPRGRPRKDASANQSEPSPAKAAKRSTKQAATSQTASRKKKATGKDEWIPIDEIEDSEEEITPSPPRRQHVPIDPPPLALSLSQEDTSRVPTLSAPAAIPADTAGPTSPTRKRKGSALISTESLTTLFPQITAMVKMASPSTDPTTPSWHEKILLYDPIVVEDLTEWLNHRGVRVLTAVPIPKPPKKKGRKKKGVEEEEEDGEQAAAEEPSEKMEMKELPGWVVQRWCEENSICCIFKETTWNGRRARC